MATIKIFDPNNSNSIEVGNNGENIWNELMLTIDHSEYKNDYLYFTLSKEEAKELIAYLKKEFRI